MTHLAIVAWDVANRVSKYQDYPTEAEAVAHVARVLGDFPDAFAAPDPGGGFRSWMIDPIAKSLSVVANPEPGPEIDADRAERQLKNDPAWRATIRREIKRRRAAGETTLTAQDVIEEYRIELP